MRAKIYIPARLESKRLDGKLLQDVNGRPLITYTIDRALESGLPLAVVTDADEIEQAVIEHYGDDVEVFLDYGDHIDGHPNGTARVAEAVNFDDDLPEIVINWQADEPCVDAEEVRYLSMKQIDDVVTLVYEADDADEKDDPNIVKVATDAEMNALYFSRCPIPHGTSRFFGHIGVYAYDRELLLRLNQLRQTHVSEQLEQLAWLANGHKIVLQRVKRPEWAINTKDELDGFREYMASQLNLTHSKG